MKTLQQFAESVNSNINEAAIEIQYEAFFDPEAPSLGAEGAGSYFSTLSFLKLVKGKHPMLKTLGAMTKLYDKWESGELYDDDDAYDAATEKIEDWMSKVVETGDSVTGTLKVKEFSIEAIAKQLKCTYGPDYGCTIHFTYQGETLEASFLNSDGENYLGELE